MKLTRQEIARKIRGMITDNLREYGLHIQYVMSDGNSPSFAYTVGMTDIGAPELLIFGLGQEAIHGPINQLYRELRDGTRPKDGRVLKELWSVKMLLEPIEKDVAAEFTVQGDAYYEETGGQPVYKQILWPDTNGKYPHQYGFDEKFRALQPYIANRHPRLDNDCGAEYFSLH